MAIPYSRYLAGPVSWYSFLIALGIWLAYLIGQAEERRVGLPRDTMIDMTLAAVPAGIIGARVYYVLLEWPRFAANPLSILFIWEGGVAIYGAVMGGMLGVFLCCRKKKIPFLTALDIIVPGLLLAQAIGRWGNYFNMEAYGMAIENPAFHFFPLAVQVPVNGAYAWHMATFFYESLWNLGGFAALMALRKKQRLPGNLLCWYLLIYGSGRFIIEGLRTDSLWLGGIRASQGLSLLLCLSASLALLWRAAPHHPAAFAAGAAAVLSALARWFFPATWLYGALLLALPAMAFLCAPRSDRRLLWLCPLLALDVAGFLLARAHEGIAPHLHALLCSLTFPCYVLWLQAALMSRFPPVKGDAKCPSET